MLGKGRYWPVYRMGPVNHPMDTIWVSYDHCTVQMRLKLDYLCIFGLIYYYGLIGL